MRVAEMEPDWRQLQLENREICFHSLRSLGEGWNSRVYLVNNELVFRFPKRREHWEELSREIAFLRTASDHLPLKVPQYVRVVTDSSAAPCGYAVYPYLRGNPMDVNSLSEENRSAAAASIAEFLRALHKFTPPPEVGSLLPREDSRIVAEGYFARAEREIAPKLSPSEVTRLIKVFEIYLSTPGNFAFQPVVLHADLGKEHILMANEVVVAAIDFGDVNWGDPDYDFVYLFIDFGSTFAEQVAWQYGDRDLEQLSKKLQYFTLVDQIGTILDGKGRALKGQEDRAWRRLNQMIGSR